MFKGRHFDRSVILLCVRWYLAYGLSLRNLEEMLAERGVTLDHSTVHRWVLHYTPLLQEHFNQRKRPVGSKWHFDETYIKVRGVWTYLYRAIDKSGATVEFYFSQTRDLIAAKSFIRKAFARHGRPEQITIDGSQTNHNAINECDTEARLTCKETSTKPRIIIRTSKYMNNRIEQDHRRIKRKTRPMLGFKSIASASITLGGIEMVQMMRKQQGSFPNTNSQSLSQQFDLLAA